MRQQYDSYKPSGIDWIGDIPSHWNIQRLKFGMNLINGRAYLQPELLSEGKYRILRVGNFFTNDSWYYSDMELEDNKYCSKGDLLYAWSASIGPYIWNEEKVIFHYHIWKVDLSGKMDKKYSYYLLGVITKVKLNDMHGSAMQHLTMENMNNSDIIVPPLAEQEAIAAWLDEKCGEIDAAIAKVDREIELIDELKQSEISRVVTRGLNPDAPLRPSGIDWIGDIPKHWTKSRIKNHISRSAAGVWGDDEKGNKNDIICFRIADFNYGERCLSFDKITIRNIDPKQLEGRYLSKGDLLIEKSGGGETTPVGRVVYCNYDGKATYTNFIHSISLSDNVDSRFFLYYFNMLYSNKINLLYFNQTTGLQNLQIGEYLGQPIYLPPLSEQQEIADYLDAKCAEIDELKAKLTKKRETLTELRQSIISEVVTGKRKVI